MKTRSSTQAHGGRLSGWALLSAIVALSGCETMPKNLATLKETIGIGAGSAVGTPAAGSAGAQTLAPANPPNRSATGKPTASTPDKGHALEVKQVGAMPVDAKKSIQLSTWQGDMACTQNVAPYTMSGNMAILAEVAAESAGDFAGRWIDSAMKANPSSKLQLENARQLMPVRLRAALVRLNWLPMSVEKLYGEMLLERMQSQLLDRNGPRSAKTYAQADALLAAILGGVEERHDYQFVVHVRKSSDTNAMALPGGAVVIDSGLLDPKYTDKARFAIAHEISHVLQRHETRALQARIVDTIAVGRDFDEVATKLKLLNDSPKAILTAVLAGKLQFERHAEVQELHADSCAVKTLDAAVKRPQTVKSVRAFVSTLKPDAPDAKDRLKGNDSLDQLQALVELVTRPVDRHPTTKERIDFLSKALLSL